MKTSKIFKITVTLRLFYFTIAFVYNLFLGFYLKDFLVLSPTLLTFYLLSVLPTLFLLTKAKSIGMRAVVYTVLLLNVLMNAAYFICCRRFLALMTIISLGIELIYFVVSADESGKDKLLTKFYVLFVSAMILTTLFSAHNFVYKQDDISLTNGHATLWDTGTEKLADKICEGCNTDAEKIKAIHDWMIHNFEYDDDCYPVIQYFDVRKTISTHKGICYDFAHLFAALCRSQNIPCYVVDGTPYDPSKECHTWNRIYFDGSWWNLDVTFDIVQAERQGQLYGFHHIENIFSPDNEYWITKIY